MYLYENCIPEGLFEFAHMDSGYVYMYCSRLRCRLIDCIVQSFEGWSDTHECVITASSRIIFPPIQAQELCIDNFISSPTVHFIHTSPTVHFTSQKDWCSGLWVGDPMYGNQV